MRELLMWSDTMVSVSSCSRLRFRSRREQPSRGRRLQAAPRSSSANCFPPTKLTAPALASSPSSRPGLWAAALQHEAEPPRRWVRGSCLSRFRCEQVNDHGLKRIRSIGSKCQRAQSSKVWVPSWCHGKRGSSRNRKDAEKCTPCSFGKRWPVSRREPGLGSWFRSCRGTVWPPRGRGTSRIDRQARFHLPPANGQIINHWIWKGKVYLRSRCLGRWRRRACLFRWPSSCWWQSFQCRGWFRRGTRCPPSCFTISR